MVVRLNVSASILRFISSLLTLFTKGFFVFAFSTDIEIGDMGNINRNLQICLVFFKTKKRTNKDLLPLFALCHCIYKLKGVIGCEWKI